MTIKKLSDLLEQQGDNKLKTIVVVCANDEHTITAIDQAVKHKIVKAILIGNETVINTVCVQSEIDPASFTIMHQPNDDLAAQLAVMIINRGEGDILMKGLINTDKFMKAILNKDKGLTDPGKVVSHVTVIENKNYPKLLVVGDVAVIPLPDLTQKIQIVKYMVDVAHRLKIEVPKVAIIAPTEMVIPAIVSTTDAALLAKMNERGQIQGCIIDGPLALDVALDEEAAAIKGLKSIVAGDADCLLFPNIESGNIFYKVNTKLAKSDSAAVLVGARVPVVLASRGDSTHVKLLSIALGALMAKE